MVNSKIKRRNKIKTAIGILTLFTLGYTSFSPNNNKTENFSFSEDDVMVSSYKNMNEQDFQNYFKAENISSEFYRDAVKEAILEFNYNNLPGFQMFHNLDGKMVSQKDNGIISIDSIAAKRGIYLIDGNRNGSIDYRRKGINQAVKYEINKLLSN